MDTAQLLRHKGLRVTHTRKKVLRIFQQKDHEALANADIEKQFPDIDRITLYRTLKTFEQKGILHQVIDGTSTSKYALCSHDCTVHDHQDEHAHFNCVQCGKTVCLEETTLPEINVPEGYQLQERYLVLSGVCNDCG